MTPSLSRSARAISPLQSIIAGMGLSALAMLAATVGWLAPVPAAIVQEVIDVAVILNALRALSPARAGARRTIPASSDANCARTTLHSIRNLDRLRAIADALDDATPRGGGAADRGGQRHRAASRWSRMSATTRARSIRGSRMFSPTARPLGHEPRTPRNPAPRAPACAARRGPPAEKIDRYLIRDAQRVIEAIETLVRIHTAQEEDIYEAVVAR